jgi:SsrA-binding protein
MHKREVSRLIGTLKESGQTLIPLSLYFKDGKVKVEMGLARGKKAHDKRASLLERQASREIDRELARRSRGRDD